MSFWLGWTKQRPDRELTWPFGALDLLTWLVRSRVVTSFAVYRNRALICSWCPLEKADDGGYPGGFLHAIVQSGDRDLWMYALSIVRKQCSANCAYLFIGVACGL